VALLDAGQSATAIGDLVSAYRAPWLVGPAGTATRLADVGVPVASTDEILGGELVRIGSAGSVASPSIHPDLQVLLSTSGTTGSRRFVRLSAGNIDVNAVAISEYLDLTPDDRPMVSLPLHYSFGLSILNSHWMSGAAAVLTTESEVQGAFWDQFRVNACTSLGGVPFTYQIFERVGFRDMKLPSLTSMQQAGGALDLRLTGIYAEHMAARGGRFFVMYGQTEGTARMAYVPPSMLPAKSGSAGRAIAGGRFSIESGEVIYEGPNVMLGYAAGADDLATGDELHGVLHTGDIGYLDDDGYLFLEGRSKRIAKLFGLRINLDEMERTVREHGPAVVVDGGDGLWAFCAFGTDESVSALANGLARRYRISSRVLHFQRVDQIPTTASGKTDYQEVQGWIPERSTPSPNHSTGAR
jgi:acyl-coenzyme A synthetase/AMP-(fatty) acid ligase